MNFSKLTQEHKLAAAILTVVFLILAAVGIILAFMDREPQPSTQQYKQGSIMELNYCNETEARPCVVSFGINKNNEMLVNILTSGVSFPRFDLFIISGGENFQYNCRQVDVSLYAVYCTGRQFLPGDQIFIRLVAINLNEILAEGNISIIGVSYPSPDTVTQTPFSTLYPSPITLTQTSVPTSYP